MQAAFSASFSIPSISISGSRLTHATCERQFEFLLQVLNGGDYGRQVYRHALQCHVIVIDHHRRHLMPFLELYLKVPHGRDKS